MIAKIKPAVFYLSEALISTTFGLILGLTSLHFIKDSIEIAIVCTGLGAYLGKKSLNVLSRLLLGHISNISGINIGNRVDNTNDTDNNEDANNDNVDTTN